MEGTSEKYLLTWTLEHCHRLSFLYSKDNPCVDVHSSEVAAVSCRRFTSNIKDASMSEAAEILEDIDKLTDEDLKVTTVKCFTVELVI